MAAIQGTAADGEGTGIEDATIPVRLTASAAKEEEPTTDATGCYSMSVPMDNCHIRTERTSYKSVEQETVVVSTVDTATVVLTLSALQPKVIGRRTDGGVGVLGETPACSGTPSD